MNFSNLRTLLAAPLASIFLIATLIVLVPRGRVSTGIQIPITRVREIESGDCQDDRDIFVFIHQGGTTKINQTPVPISELKGRLSEIFLNRREQNVVYVLSDPEVQYGDFVRIYNEVVSSTPNLYVGLITPQLNLELLKCRLGAICGLKWPDGGYQHSCLNFNVPPVVIPRITKPTSNSTKAPEALASTNL